MFEELTVARARHRNLTLAGRKSARVSKRSSNGS